MTDLHKLSDLELLELAAEAGNLPWAQWVEDGDDSWNSLQDPGDALRLAVVVGISFKYERNAPPELGLPRECAVASVDGRWYSATPVNFDEVAATCRAITIAAAAVALAKRASLEPAC